MTFKGGTSLSKCFNLIHRFSEDIDLILDWRVIGYGLDEPWEKRTNSKQDKFNKDSIKRTEEFLKSDFLIKLESELKNRLDRYYVAVAQNPKRKLNRSKISNALNYKNRVKGISFTAF